MKEECDQYFQKKSQLDTDIRELNMTIETVQQEEDRIKTLIMQTTSQTYKTEMENDKMERKIQSFTKLGK